jgi:hypothetical protein
VVGPLSQAESIEERCRAFLKEREIQVQDIATRFAVESERAEITFKIRTRNRLQSVEVVRAIASHPGLLEVRWV